MQGWIIPPPKEPTKSKAEFEQERAEKVNWLVANGFLKSRHIQTALLNVPREEFIPKLYRDYAYMEVPLPLPGEQSTISCPHSYPLFYEPLELDEGQRFLEIGTGSGYGAAVAREVIGPDGLVVSVEIDPLTLAFARQNLERAGFLDIVLVHGDGHLGYAQLSPYDRIAATAASQEIPPAWIEQLTNGGKLIAPVWEDQKQVLTLLEKSEQQIHRQVLTEVLYVSLRDAS